MFEQIKTHVDRNKKVYTGVGIGVGVSLAGVAVLCKFSNPDLKPTQKLLVLGKARDVNQVMVNFIERSTPSKPVHLLGSTQYFDSVSDAARKLGLDRSLISKNVNGHIPDVKGYTFKAL